jgi:hypothetical protein
MSSILDFHLNLKEAEQKITSLFKLTVKENQPSLYRMAKIVFIYRYIALNKYDKPDAMKLAMKYVSIEMLLTMMKDYVFDLDEMENYLKKQTSLINMENYICNHCLTIGALYKCGRCKKVQYCSQVCQKQAWKNHKFTCTIVGPKGCCEYKIFKKHKN